MTARLSGKVQHVVEFVTKARGHRPRLQWSSEFGTWQEATRSEFEI